MREISREALPGRIVRKRAQHQGVLDKQLLVKPVGGAAVYQVTVQILR